MRILLFFLISSFHLTGYDFDHPKYELIQKALVEQHNFTAEDAFDRVVPVCPSTIPVVPGLWNSSYTSGVLYIREPPAFEPKVHKGGFLYGGFQNDL